MEAVRRLTGAYALAMIFAGEESLLIGARKGSPLAVGYGADEAYLGSDAFALAPFTNRISYLEDGDVAVLRGPRRDDLSTSKAASPIARSRSPMRRRGSSTRAATAISWRRRSTSSPK